MNDGNMYWFTGEVVNINDPNKSGLVKVAIHGIHDAADNSTLPWSQVILPTISSGNSSVGMHHYLEVGSWVTGFYMDGHNRNIPVVNGVLAGINKSTGEQDYNSLARGSFNSTANKRLIQDTTTVNGNNIKFQNVNAVVPTYTNDFVIQSKSGHLIELNDTVNGEAVTLTHNNGTYINIAADGSITLSAKAINILPTENLNVVTKNINISADNFNLQAKNIKTVCNSNVTDTSDNLINSNNNTLHTNSNTVTSSTTSISSGNINISSFINVNGGIEINGSVNVDGSLTEYNTPVMLV